MNYKQYLFGRTAAIYVERPFGDREGACVWGLAVYPAEKKVDPATLACDSLVQVALAGDEGLIDYAMGMTMRNRSSTLLHLEDQVREGDTVTTILSDVAGNFYTHVLIYDEKTEVFRTKVIYENRSGETRTLERLDSFSLSGIGGRDGSAHGLRLHRMNSAWSRECRLQTDSFSHLGLEASWARHGPKVEHWGQVGSMPNRGYFPFGAIEAEDYALGVLLEAPYSWQMEVYLEEPACAFSGGLADYERGHWKKSIRPGERFETHEAYFTVQRDLGNVCNALVRFQDERLEVPASEEEMPILFNEYCTTWGCPSEANIREILTSISGMPISYFVIDAGWYKPDGKSWLNAVGDWQESRELFPGGVAAVTAAIRNAGMIPGIWFEFEVAGRDSACFSKSELLLRRDGCTVTSKNRRFLDLRTAEADAYLQERMVGLLQRADFGYIKIDYNDNYGIGCDSADGAAAGEGGRQVAEASIEWLERLKAAVPGLVIENCASGGSRIEPLRMHRVSMCSFSDAHECPEIPLVAANLTRVVPARQLQIWAVLRAGESDARTVYSLCAAMFGRICLSGDVVGLSPAKKQLICAGLAFYQEVKDIVRHGNIVLFDSTVESYRHPAGRQVYCKKFGARTLVLVHSLDFYGEVKLPVKGSTVIRAYTDLPYTMSEDGLSISCEPFHAGAFLLSK